MRNEIEEFISLLKLSPPPKGIFNPWRDVDRGHPANGGATAFRTKIALLLS